MTSSLPQLAGDRVFLTDGGLETTLIFHRGIDLPDFAAFPLLDDAEGRAALRDYFRAYITTAREQGAGSSSTPSPGARTATGASGSATTRPRSTVSTATPSPSPRSYGRRPAAHRIRS
jgi:S-methylmethionine-dependent homocysteine/selenocysteine methylase